MFSRKRSRSRSVSPVPLRPAKVRKVEDSQENRPQPTHGMVVPNKSAPEVDDSMDVERNTSPAVDNQHQDDNASIPPSPVSDAAPVPVAATADETFADARAAIATPSKPSETPSPASIGTADTRSELPLQTPITKQPAQDRVDSHQQPVQFMYETPATIASSPLTKASRTTRDTPKTPAPQRGRSCLAQTVTAAAPNAEDGNASDEESATPGTSKLVPDKERIFAQVGTKNESLAHITCTNRVTGEKKELHFKQLFKMDWDDPRWIERLNSWSSQIHRRAGERRKDVKVWHPDEETWLEIFVFKLLLHAMKPENQQRVRIPTREVLTYHFNNFFDGRVVPNGIGKPQSVCTARVPGAVVSKLDRFHPRIQKQMKSFLLAKDAETHMPQITVEMFEPFCAAKRVLWNGLKNIYKGKLDRKKLNVDLELIGGPDPELQLWETFFKAVENIGSNVNVAATPILAPAAVSTNEEDVDDGYVSAVSTPAPAPRVSKGSPKKARAPGTKVKGAYVEKRPAARSVTKALAKDVQHATRGRSLFCLSEEDLTTTESLLGQMSDVFQPPYPRRAHSIPRAVGKSAWDDGTMYNVGQAL